MRVAFLGVVVGAVGLGSKVTPIQSVVQQLQNILKTAKAERAEEQKLYETYKQWCGDMQREKTREISELKDEIADAQARRDVAKDNIACLEKHIQQHTQADSLAEGDEKAFTNVRNVERAKFEETNKDYSESLEALRGAIKVLKAQNFDRAQAQSLLQTAARKAPRSLRDAVSALVQTFAQQQAPAKQDEEDNDLEQAYHKDALLATRKEEDFIKRKAPEAHGYEFQSQKVIDMLQKLYDEFDQMMVDLNKEETQRAHDFDMAMDNRKSTREFAQKGIQDKSQQVGKNKEDLATAEADLSTATESLNVSEKYLADVTAQCDQKAEEYKDRTQMRLDEEFALAKAIDVLTSEFSFDKHFLFLQVSHDDDDQSPLRMDHASNFLRDTARRLDSPVLSALAMQVGSGHPFGKVMQLIRDLITRLQNEATAESEQKGWCDTELGKNKNTREQKTTQKETLTAEIEELNGRIADLADQILEHGENVQKMESDKEKAAETRQEEARANEKEIQESKDCQAAVGRALDILNDFYDRAAKGTAFLATATSHKETPPPPIWDSPYQGQTGSTSGPLAMLEVVRSDCERTETEASDLERTQSDAHDKFNHETDVAIKQESTDQDFKEREKSKAESRVKVADGELVLATKELKAALRYFEKLKPPCVKPEVSFEDRVQMRNDEIEALNEALQILTGQND
jgi:hypothetical protein